MKLDDFLTQNDLTETTFATRIGSCQSHVNRLRHGKSFPSPDMIRKIESASDGSVAVADWYADVKLAG